MQFKKNRTAGDDQFENMMSPFTKCLLSMVPIVMIVLKNHTWTVQVRI